MPLNTIDSPSKDGNVELTLYTLTLARRKTIPLFELDHLTRSYLTFWQIRCLSPYFSLFHSVCMRGRVKSVSPPGLISVLQSRA